MLAKNSIIMMGTIIFVGLIGCRDPKVNPNLPKQIPEKWLSPSTSLMFQVRWTSVKKPKMPSYPTLSHLARVQGMTVMDLEIDINGAVKKVTRIDGPPQLMATAENYAKELRFEPSGQNWDGNWTFRFFMNFELDNYIGVGPSPDKLEVESVYVRRSPF